MKTPLAFSRWTAASLIAALLLLAGGCQSPDSGRATASPSTPAQNSAKPNFGPPVQDVRTETAIQEMEQWYNAEKNSQPTHQHEAEAEAARKAKEKKTEAKPEAASDKP